MKFFKNIFFVLLIFPIVFSVNAFASKTDLTVGLQLEPPHLDPTGAAAGAIDQVLYSNVFEGLTRFASDGSIIPGLAKSWDVSSDGMTYTFHLQKDVKFHDGTDMNAMDVKFSLDRARAEDTTNAQKALFAGITNVEVVDNLKVKITLDKPNGNFLFNLAWGDSVVVAVDSIENIKQNPIGTGAFVFDMMAEDVDVFKSFPAPENLVQFEADSRFKVLIGSNEGETILSTNNKMEPFNNLKVRKALAHAINRKAIIDGAMFGYGTPIGTHFAPHHPAYVDLTSQSRYDPELSKKLLSEAGFPDGFTTTLKLPPPAYARKGGEIIASQLRDVGINVEISNLEWAQWLEEVFRGKDYGLTIVSHTEPFDIGIYARPEYYFQYDSKEFQNVINDLTAETNEDQRTSLMQKAQKIIADDYVNGYLFQRAQLSVINSKVNGMWKNSPTQATDLTAVYWEN